MPPPRPSRVPFAREVWTAIRTAGVFFFGVLGGGSQQVLQLKAGIVSTAMSSEESRTRNQMIPARRLNLRPEVCFLSFFLGESSKDLDPL